MKIAITSCGREQNSQPDMSFGRAMEARKSVVEFPRKGVAEDIRRLWRTISES